MGTNLGDCISEIQKLFDNETKVREKIVVDRNSIDLHTRNASVNLSKCLTSSSYYFKEIAKSSEDHLKFARESIHVLKNNLGTHPFFKYHHLYAATIQLYTKQRLLAHFLESLYDVLFVSNDENVNKTNNNLSLLDPQEFSNEIGIPFECQLGTENTDNTPEDTLFYITVEDYLYGVLYFMEEMPRLVVNAVTLAATSNDVSTLDSETLPKVNPTFKGKNPGYILPILIGKFTKDIFAGFMSLNMKNDGLRRHSDKLKYNVSKIDDIIYDISIRNLQ